MEELSTSHLTLDDVIQCEEWFHRSCGRTGERFASAKKKEMDTCTIMIAALLTIIKVADHMNRPFWQCEDCDTTI